MSARHFTIEIATDGAAVELAEQRRGELVADVANLIEKYGAAEVAFAVRVASGDRSAEELARARAELMR